VELKLVALRDQLPAVSTAVYLNTGTAGAMPTTVHSAMATSIHSQWQQGRIHMHAFVDQFATRDRIKAALATMLNCDASELALVQSTTEGMNQVTLGIPWQPGDEAITTDLEHPASHFPLFVVRDRFGVNLKVARLRTAPETAVAAIERLLTPRTRLISLSHVSYLTGARLPIAEICAVAHRHGVPVLVDGAQSFCAMPTDLKQLGCDFFTLPGQKWVCGPDGLGALYASRAALALLRPSFTGYASAEVYTSEGMILQRGTHRFEQGLIQPALLAGLQAALTWWRDEVGSAWAFKRIAQLAAKVRQGLLNIPGVDVLTPADHAGLISFNVSGKPPMQIVESLSQQGILVRSVPDPAAVRVATSFYNTEAEIKAFLSFIAGVRT